MQDMCVSFHGPSRVVANSSELPSVNNILLKQLRGVIGGGCTCDIFPLNLLHILTTVVLATRQYYKEYFKIFPASKFYKKICLSFTYVLSLNLNTFPKVWPNIVWFISSHKTVSHAVNYLIIFYLCSSTSLSF